MQTIAFIQARLGSTRFPGKVLKNLAGKPVLQHVLDRVSHSNVDEVVVLTTLSKQDLDIVKFVSGLGYRVFCGSEDDVLDRFWQAAKILKPDNIMRVTADCPVIDPQIINQILSSHQKFNCDYSSNVLVESFPDGQDVEVFTIQALEKAWKEAALVSEREHVTPYIRKHPEFFRHFNVESPVNLNKKRWTLDTQEDYIFLEKIFNALSKSNEFFGMNSILDFLEKNPEVEAINGQIVRNEGYLKSLKNDNKK